MQELLKYPFLSSAKAALEAGKSELGGEQFEKAITRAVDSVSIGIAKKTGGERVFAGVSPVGAAEIFTTSRILVSLIDSEF